MKRHSFDLFSAFFGVVFATFGILLLSGRHGLEPRHLAVVGPVVVVAAGVALLASVLRAALPRRPAAEGYAYPEEPSELPGDEPAPEGPAEA